MRHAKMLLLVIWVLSIHRSGMFLGGDHGDYRTLAACKAAGDKAVAASTVNEAKATAKEYGDLTFSCTPDNGQAAIYGPDGSYVPTPPK
jgi:hypothetical protein